jgi:uncharacterized membrane protein
MTIAHPHQPSAAPPRSRNVALDALRGLIVVLMAVDHANYFVAHQHSSGEYWGGPFPACCVSCENRAG